MSEIFGNGVMGGGGLTNSKLALANAQAADVRSGKKFYAGDKQIKTGTLADVTQATPAITVDADGKITASATQDAGVVAAGTKSATKQLPVQAGETVMPSSSIQTIVASQRFTTGDVKVAAVNGVIRVSYPANSTLVVKGTSSGKQFAKDTNTTSSAKAYIFLAPIGDASYTLTATNTAGKTVSKRVYVAKDQVQSVVLAYELILFDGSTGTVASGYSWLGHDILHDNFYGYYIVFYGYGGGTAGNISPMIDVSNYSTLKIKACLYGDAMAGTGYGAIGLYKTLPDWAAASVAPIAGIQIGIGQSSQPRGLSAAQEYTVDISALSGEYYFAGVSKGWNPAALQVELS